MRRGVSRLFEWGFAVALIAAILIWGGLEDMHRMLEADPGQLLLGLATTLIIATSSCTKWRTVVSSVAREATPAWRQFYYYFFLARISGLLAPMAVGDAGVRVLSLRLGHRISLTHAGYSVYLERSFDLIVALLALAPGLLFLTGALALEVCVALLAVLLLISGVIFYAYPLFAPRALARLFLFARRAAGRVGFLARFVTRGRPVEPVTEMPIPKRQALLLYVLSFTGLFALALRFYFILQAVGVDVPFLPLLLCVPVGQLLTVLAITPGGLGILEAGWYGLFAILGVPGSQIVLAVVSARTFVVLFIVIMYALTWIWARVKDTADPVHETDGSGEEGRRRPAEQGSDR